MPALTLLDLSNYELVAGFALTAAGMGLFAWWTARDRRSVVEMAMGLLFGAMAIPALWFLLAVPWINSRFHF
jgi:hypothetical protein